MNSSSKTKAKKEKPKTGRWSHGKDSSGAIAEKSNGTETKTTPTSSSSTSSSTSFSTTSPSTSSSSSSVAGMIEDAKQHTKQASSSPTGSTLASTILNVVTSPRSSLKLSPRHSSSSSPSLPSSSPSESPDMNQDRHQSYKVELVNLTVQPSLFQRDFSTRETISLNPPTVIATSNSSKTEYVVKKVDLPLFEKGSVETENVIRMTEELLRLNHPNVVRHQRAWIEYESCIPPNLHDQSFAPSQAFPFGGSPSGLPSHLLTRGNLGTFNRFERSDPQGVPHIAHPDELSESVDSYTAITFTEYNLTTDASDNDPTDSDESYGEDFTADTMSETVSEATEQTVPSIIKSSKIPRFRATLFIQMELCNISLQQYIDQRNSIEVPYNLMVFRKIVEGLNYVHTLNIIHNSLRPSNIFLVKHGNTYDLIKIGGFELKFVSPSKTSLLSSTINNDSTDWDPSSESDQSESEWSTNNESTDSRMGNAMHTSPDSQMLSGLSLKSDIYSLGILLFELFCDERNKSVRSKILSDLKDRIIPTSLLLSHPNICAMTLWLMSPLPNDRPNCADILKSSLFEASGDNKVFVPRQELENLDRKIQSQESKIQAQESIIKEQEKQIQALTLKVKKPKRDKSREQLLVNISQ